MLLREFVYNNDSRRQHSRLSIQVNAFMNLQPKQCKRQCTYNSTTYVGLHVHVTQLVSLPCLVAGLLHRLHTAFQVSLIYSRNILKVMSLMYLTFSGSSPRINICMLFYPKDLRTPVRQPIIDRMVHMQDSESRQFSG